MELGSADSEPSRKTMCHRFPRSGDPGNPNIALSNAQESQTETKPRHQVFRISFDWD